MLYRGERIEGRAHIRDDVRAMHDMGYHARLIYP